MLTVVICLIILTLNADLYLVQQPVMEYLMKPIKPRRRKFLEFNIMRVWRGVQKQKGILASLALTPRGKCIMQHAAPFPTTND